MKRILFLTAAFCLFTFAVFAQNKADFSGNWELDVEKSKLDDRARVESITMNVTQTEKEIKIETATKTSRVLTSGAPVTRTYNLDGKETTGEFQSVDVRGMMTFKADWENDGKLNLTSTSSLNVIGAGTATTKEKWELTDGGKTLKVKRETVNLLKEKSSVNLVFTKTGAAKIVAETTAPSETKPAGNIVKAGVINSRAKRLVKPEYPQAARYARATGAVHVEVIIDETGDVIFAKAVAGHALLRTAAEVAAKKSKFEPTLLEGVPVKVTGVIIYYFGAY